MKKIALTFLLLGFIIVLKAQTSAEKEVLTMVEKMRLALISGNRSDLKSIASKDLSYGHSSGKIEDVTAFVESIASGKSDFVTAEFNKQTIKVSGETALVRHQLDAKTNDGGKPGEIHLGILLVWHKENSGWKLLGRQAYKLP